MLDLIARRPTRPSIRPTPAPVGGWRDRLAAWLGPHPGPPSLGDPADGLDPALEELAGLAASAREADEIRVALVRLAGAVVGPGRVELFGDRGGHLAGRLACWPPGHHPSTLADPPSGPRGPIALAGRDRDGRDRAAPSILLLPLKAGESTFGTLRVTADRPASEAWPAAAVRRLRALCAVAAAAERGLAGSRSQAPGEPIVDPEIGPRGSTMLGAFLGFALAQARRRHEPLSLLDVSVDRLGTLRSLMGEELGELAIDRVCRAIKATVRASDVIVRLEDGRVAVILPHAAAPDAARVAETVRAAIARSCAASAAMPALTASIGLATYPETARDLATLRAAASTARAGAEAEGADRVAPAPPLP